MSPPTWAAIDGVTAASLVAIAWTVNFRVLDPAMMKLAVASSADCSRESSPRREHNHCYFGHPE